MSGALHAYPVINTEKVSGRRAAYRTALRLAADSDVEFEIGNSLTPYLGKFNPETVRSLQCAT